MSRTWWWGVYHGGGRAQEMPDAAGEVALEGADGVAGGLAFGVLARDVVLRFGMTPRPSDCNAMDRGVDLPVAAAIEAVTVRFARANRDRREARGARELGIGIKALRTGDLADELGGGQRREIPAH